MTDLPAGWRWSTLGEIADVVGGVTKDSKLQSRPDLVEVPYLRVANVQRGRFDLSNVATIRVPPQKAAQLELQPGDVLLNEGGDRDKLGRGWVWQGQIPGCIHQNHVFRARIRDESLHPKLLAWYANEVAHKWFELNGKQSVNLASISLSMIRTFPVPIPPLEEQRHLVDILDDHLSRLEIAEAGVGAASVRTGAWRKALLLRAVLGADASSDAVARLAGLSGSELGGPREPGIDLPVGWTWKKWKDVGGSQNGKAFPSKDYCTRGVKLLRPGNMGPAGSLHWNDAATRFLPDRYRESHATSLLLPGDIVMNLTAQSLKDDFLGRVCLVGAGDEALLNQRIARLRADKMLPEFALLVFRSFLFRKYVKSLNSGSLIQHMFTKQVNEFWLPVPGGDVQRQLVSEAAEQEKEIARLVSAIQAARRRTRSLRQALLDAAFSGRLTGRASDMDIIEEMAGV